MNDSILKKKVLIFDTSILCCWLRIPGKDTCGPSDDLWHHDRISELVNQERVNGSTFVLPVASIIETGNFIAQTGGDKYSLAVSLSDKIKAAATATEPWAAFSHQSDLWETGKLQLLADKWPSLAAQGLGIGDATIKDVAEFYALSGAISVEILTGDAGLKAYEPSVPLQQPRRRGR